MAANPLIQKNDLLARIDYRDAPLSAELRPFLPTDGTWQVSEQYAEDVRTSQYNGTVYLDARSGTVFLRVIDS
ncbi:hypothetical protein [Micromonospora sp. NPDC005206]|uniref:hypothetical protein n=1 Tax=Micromonospora sp. NPDC005206 TaxID=3157022 RepID=UPI0033BE775B